MKSPITRSCMAVVFEKQIVHCALCERDTVQPKAPPPTRPALMPPTHRRPREVDTSMHFCPHSDCDYRGWLELGNLRANGHPGGGPHPWRVRSRRTCPWGAAAGVGARVRSREGPAPSPRDAAPHVVLRLRRPPGSRAASRTPEGAPPPFPESRDAGPQPRARVAARRCRSPSLAARGARPDSPATNEPLGPTVGASQSPPSAEPAAQQIPPPSGGAGGARVPPLPRQRAGGTPGGGAWTTG